MGLIADNKKFLQLITSSPGTTYDARLLRDSTLSKDIQSGGTVPNKSTKKMAIITGRWQIINKKCNYSVSSASCC